VQTAFVKTSNKCGATGRPLVCSRSAGAPWERRPAFVNKPDKFGATTKLRARPVWPVNVCGVRYGRFTAGWRAYGVYNRIVMFRSLPVNHILVITSIS
jgi:hypothetical protein